MFFFSGWDLLLAITLSNVGTRIVSELKRAFQTEADIFRSVVDQENKQKAKSDQKAAAGNMKKATNDQKEAAGVTPRVDEKWGALSTICNLNIEIYFFFCNSILFFQIDCFFFAILKSKFMFPASFKIVISVFAII